MIQRMLASALFAGFAAGLFAALLHFSLIQNLILLGEDYESGARVHFQDAPAMKPSAMTGHDHAAPDPGAVTEGEPASNAKPAAHDHGAGHSAEPTTLTRNALTVLFSALVYVAYALLLVAGFALAEQFGLRVGLREGILWGIAGFASFQLAPAMGLAPELPGTIAAELHLRQIWWLGTVLATGTGLALLGYGRGLAAIVVAVVLLAAPHVIGAPELDTYWGAAPPEVAAAFAARVLGVGLAVWAVLGGLAGWFWSSRSTV